MKRPPGGRVNLGRILSDKLDVTRMRGKGSSQEAETQCTKTRIYY